MTITKKELQALFRMLTKVGSAVVNRWSKDKKQFYTIPVVSINEKDPDKDQIGYTASNRKIHLNPYHKLITELPEKEKQIKMLKGVWTHEIMHQLMTDFSLSDTLLRRPTQVESHIYHTIFNIVEDARIEYFAPSYIGGKYTTDEFDEKGRLRYMSDLSFMKLSLYKKAPPIDAKTENGESPDPLTQVINAMVMYGDCGIVKGKFISKEAKDIFYELLPLYDKAIEEPLFRVAVKLYIQIAEITRPLWQQDAEFEKAVKEMFDKTSGGHDNGNRSISSANNTPAAPKGEGSESVANKGRAATKKVRAEEINELAKSGKLSVSEEGSSVEIENPEDLSEEALKALLASGSSSDEKGDSESETASGKGEGSDEVSGSAIDSGNNDERQYEESSEEGSEGSAKKSLKEVSEDDPDEDSESDRKDPKSTSPSDSNGCSEEGKPEEAPEGDFASDGREDPESKGKSASKFSMNTLGHIERANDKKLFRNEIDCDEEIVLSPEGVLKDIDDYVIPESELRSIANELDKFIREINAEEKMLNDDTDVPIEIPNVKSRYFDDVSVINRNVRVVSISDETNTSSAVTKKSEIKVTSSEIEYRTYVESLGSSISALEKQFKRIFKNRPEEILHKSSGKVNIGRMTSGRITSRIFDKKRPAGKPSDIAIFLLIDESGSMCCHDRYKYARVASIGLAELCNRLGIPVYVMGFTADEGGYQAVHLHYVKWKNTKASRMSLLAVSARSNNFDGYSVRYAAKILEKRSELHKLLFVISDGAPAANAYLGRNGMADTLQAVKEASRICTPVGMSIGDTSCAKHIKALYGSNAVVVPDVSSLFTQLGTALRKIVKQEI